MQKRQHMLCTKVEEWVSHKLTYKTKELDNNIQKIYVVAKHYLLVRA